MILGFTGSRDGMTPIQRKTMRGIVVELKPTEGHHGDCVGSDEGFHELCKELGIRTIGHPPEAAGLRAFSECDEMRQERPYIERNRAIVGEVECMIGCPRDEQEPSMRQGQGTWATIRYAIMKGVPIYIVLPSGKIEKR